MPPLSSAEVLRVAEELLEDHRPGVGLPVDLAVHAAAMLAGERPRYTELCAAGGRHRLVYTLVTARRVLQLSVRGDRSSGVDGVDVETDVWRLETPEDVALLPPRPRAALDDSGATHPGGPGRAG